MRMRKVLTSVIATVVTMAVLVVGVLGIDYGTSIYAEYSCQ